MKREKADEEADEDERTSGEPSSEESAEDKVPEGGGKEDSEERTSTARLWRPRWSVINRAYRLGMA